MFNADNVTDSVKTLEGTTGWAITSASSSPSTVTMTYKSHLELFFYPSAFATADSSRSSQNESIRLTYVANSLPQRPIPLTTTLRFFLQLLRASLHALPQCTTRIPELLNLIKVGWDAALQVVEAERRLSLDGMTHSRILSDERLAICCAVLLPKVRTKVFATYEIAAWVGDNLDFCVAAKPTVEVVYGEKYNEKMMTEFLINKTGKRVDGWDGAVGELRTRLVAKGPKAVTR